MAAGLLTVIGLGLWRANNTVLVDRMSGVNENTQNLAQNNRACLDEIDEDRENVYLFDVYANPASVNAAFTFWEIRPDTYCPNRFDLGGWDPRHPYYVNLLDQQGITNPVRALIERTNAYSTYSSRLLVYLRTYYNYHITASGTKVIQGTQLVQYTQFISDNLLSQDETKKAVINEFYNSGSGDAAWYFSATISDFAEQERVFYCNVNVNGERYTYRLKCEGNHIWGMLYGIDGSFDLGTAQIRVFEKTENGYTEYTIQ